MAVGASLSLSVSASESKTSGISVGNALWSGAIAQALTFGNGTTANNIDLVYVNERTVASGANDDIDIAGTLASALGTTFAAAKLIGIIVVNTNKTAANTTAITVGGSTNGVPGYTTAVESIAPGGIYMAVSPDLAGLATVTAGTGDILRITNAAGASNTYSVAILARTA